jgi:aminoglycoside phosphotransferase (APT) family kinase protein
VLQGGDGYCLLEPLRTYSSTTAALLVAVQALVMRHADAHCATGDLVHYDFNPTNLLVQDGMISGVIDWQDPCSGDCTFDLSTLLFYCWEISELQDRLWSCALDRAGPRMLGVYLAHMILRQVDWAIRHHGAADTARWCRIAQDILAACRALGVT